MVTTIRERLQWLEIVHAARADVGRCVQPRSIIVIAPLSPDLARIGEIKPSNTKADVVWRRYVKLPRYHPVWWIVFDNEVRMSEQNMQMGEMVAHAEGVVINPPEAEKVEEQEEKEED